MGSEVGMSTEVGPTVLVDLAPPRRGGSGGARVHGDSAPGDSGGGDHDGDGGSLAAQTPRLLPAAVAAVLASPHDSEVMLAHRASFRRAVVAQPDGGLMVVRLPHRCSIVVGPSRCR